MAIKGNTQAGALLKTVALIWNCISFFCPLCLILYLLSSQGVPSVPDHGLPFFGFKEGISLTGMLIKGQGLS